MNQVVYRPNFSNDHPFGNLHRSISRIFDDRMFPAVATDAAEWAPRVDIHEEQDSYVLHVDLPGVEAKDIEVTLDKNVLTIKGERNSQNTSEEKGFTRRERFSGSFVRKFTLPETADGQNISAANSNGVLTLTIGKKVESQPRRIEVS
jgi:HSP20 family protein